MGGIGMFLDIGPCAVCAAGTPATSANSYIAFEHAALRS